MAAISSRPNAQALIDALPPNDNSFLSRCIIDLNPTKTSGFCSYKTHSTLWLVAAGTTFVAFTALAAGAFFYVGMFMPAYVPFAGLGALVCATLVANLVKNLLEYSEVAGKKGDKFSRIQTNFNEINAKTPQQLQNDLAARGIAWHQIPGVSNPESLSKLSPILAHAKYLDEKMEKELRLKQKLTQQASELENRLDNRIFSKHRQEIYDLRHAALFAEDRALHTKVDAAFANAVLRKSNYSGTLRDIAIVTDVGYHERILGEALGETTSSGFLEFKNRTFTPISHADVKRMSIAELGQRLVAAMA